MALFSPANHAAATNLVFDAVAKEYTAKQGELTAEFSFALTNVGPSDIIIHSVHASCGCTTPKLPELPWTIAPGKDGSFHATVDLRGKFGTFQKSISLNTSEGMKVLLTKCILPDNANSFSAVPGVDSRTRNMQLAQADRQIVFRNDCANCHSRPAIGKMGEPLYTAACAICHEAEHRAEKVPDLQALKQKPTEAYWEAWIRHGKAGSMMPAFAKEQQGPLTDEQITSLVSYLMTDFPTRKPHPPITAPAPVAVPAGSPIVPRTARATRPTPLPVPSISQPFVRPPSAANQTPSPVPDGSKYQP